MSLSAVSAEFMAKICVHPMMSSAMMAKTSEEMSMINSLHHGFASFGLICKCQTILRCKNLFPISGTTSLAQFIGEFFLLKLKSRNFCHGCSKWNFANLFKSQVNPVIMTLCNFLDVGLWAWLPLFDGFCFCIICVVAFGKDIFIICFSLELLGSHWK